jgi:hypothetical protein
MRLADVIRFMSSAACFAVRNRIEAANLFVEDLFRRGNVDLGLIEDNRRRFFDCGFGPSNSGVS